MADKGRSKDDSIGTLSRHCAHKLSFEPLHYNRDGASIPLACVWWIFFPPHYARALFPLQLQKRGMKKKNVRWTWDSRRSTIARKNNIITIAATPSNSVHSAQGNSPHHRPMDFFYTHYFIEKNQGGQTGGSRRGPETLPPILKASDNQGSRLLFILVLWDIPYCYTLFLFFCCSENLVGRARCVNSKSPRLRQIAEGNVREYRSTMLFRHRDFCLKLRQAKQTVSDLCQPQSIT